MPMFYSRLALLFLIPAMIALPHAVGQSEPTAQSRAELTFKGQMALRDGNRKAAMEVAELLTSPEQGDPTAREMMLAADILLRCGKPARAVEWYDKCLKEVPDQLPYMWQRGIALYFAGDHDKGVAQFEKHRRVNPNDVENAAWHFLCVAKAKSMDEAKRVVLPAPNDPRIPMKEVLNMLSTGDTASVQTRMDATEPGSAQRVEADFYGNFYLGLYADAQGKTANALKLMELSATDVPHHYMGDVARVYVDYLKQQLDDEKSPPSDQ